MVTSATQTPARGARRRTTSRSRRRCSPTEAPTVSDDGKTITYTIRDDVKFSPPVDREATAADVKYAIERSLLPGVPNGYVQTYLADVEGIDEAIKAAQDDPTGGAPDISGITAPDDTTLEIKLTNTSALGVIGALTLPVSAPVPEEYAKEFDAENPSTYGENQVATGPYMIENYTPQQGDPPGSQPELGASDADYRPAYLDEITVQEGFADTVSAGKKILTGSAQVNGDFGAAAERRQAGGHGGRGGPADADPERR